MHRGGTEVAKKAQRAHSHLAPVIVAEVQSSPLAIIKLVSVLEDRALDGGDIEKQHHFIDRFRLAATHKAPAVLPVCKYPPISQTRQALKARRLRPQLFEVTTNRKTRVPSDPDTKAIVTEFAHEALAIGNRERHPSCSHTRVAGCASQLSEPETERRRALPMRGA